MMLPDPLLQDAQNAGSGASLRARTVSGSEKKRSNNLALLLPFKMVRKGGTRPYKKPYFKRVFKLFLICKYPIPDKIPDRKMKTWAKTRGGGGNILVTVAEVTRQTHQKPI